MSSSEPEITSVSTGEGVQQIPAQIQVQVVQPPAETEARDALLRAISQEAQYVAEKSAGQAAAALVELARAYALVTQAVDAPSAASPSVHTRNLGDMNFD
ncbi:hypothetical protein [Streptomyces sp. NBC_01244]|uniref:hypothetical protein n=1 Tax=Streptomyces sp. NBC_01244 TaxID=2903797 RepID=UPI002E1517F2|nr:hypothetical protein OG247_07355 [Streptomyces sp. NBC_01244]